LKRVREGADWPELKVLDRQLVLNARSGMNESLLFPSADDSMKAPGARCLNRRLQSYSLGGQGKTSHTGESRSSYSRLCPDPAINSNFCIPEAQGM